MKPFTLQKGSFWTVPIVHYHVECAAEVKKAFDEIQPDCVAVELPEPMQAHFLAAANRLPDVSMLMTRQGEETLYTSCEPCEGTLEGLRSAAEHHVPAFCIDLDISHYPQHQDLLPDPYAIGHIGLKKYYEACGEWKKDPLDLKRELHMAQRLKELSFRYERILFVCGMAHAQSVLDLTDREAFDPYPHTLRDEVSVCTLNEESCREVLAEYGWVSCQYERWRNGEYDTYDRHEWIFKLYRDAGELYTEETGYTFTSAHLRNLMKFSRNYALIHQRLQPNLYEVLSAAKGCVDHNYAYEVWKLATNYPHLKNIDNLPELNLTIEEVWGHAKQIRFQLKEQSRKSHNYQKRQKDKNPHLLHAPSPYSICSFPPEDFTIENFADNLKKRGSRIYVEAKSRTLPFTTSLEDGIDIRETLRKWYEGRLYVKIEGQKQEHVGSVVVVFEDEMFDTQEKFPWATTWLGEHNQESDMAFYATSLDAQVVGPGISRCQYGGFMMSYPPLRLYDVWNDEDYQDCESKAEILLMAGIDYAKEPLVTYVAKSPPSQKIKSFAARFGKKIIYVPLSQLSSIQLNKIQTFHVLDGHHRREIANDYIF